MPAHDNSNIKTTAIRPLNEDKLAKTTGWCNNCAFNCVVGFLSDEFRKASTDEINALYQQAGYKEILQEFNRYYQLNLLSGHELQLLMQRYQNPIDREVILAPILRARLGSLIKEQQKNEQAAAHMRESFLADVQMLLSGKMDLINPSLITSNVEFLKEFSRILVEEGKATGEAWDIVFEKHIKELEIYWDKEGYKKYAEFVGNINNSAAISEQEFSVLTKSLNIGLRVYSPAEENGPTFEDLIDDKTRILTVFNGGFHWEREVNSKEDAASHNINYEVLKDLDENYHHVLEALFEKFQTEEITYEDYLIKSELLRDRYSAEITEKVNLHIKKTREKFEFWKALTSLEIEKSTIQKSVQKNFVAVKESLPKPRPAFTSQEFLEKISKKLKKILPN